MIKKTVALCAFGICMVAGNANASILLNFDGVGNGAQVLDFYNGGTDSQGNSGINYGIHFSGGTVAYNQFGAYIQGPASIQFAADIVPIDPISHELIIGFLAVRHDIDGGPSSIFGPGYLDSEWIQGTENPFCPYTGVDIPSACNSQFPQIPLSTLFGYSLFSDGTATSINFNTDGLDDIEFGATGSPAIRGSTQYEIPEPATAALLILGALSFALSRRKRSFDLKVLLSNVDV
jgi:hypothetical protein